MINIDVAESAFKKRPDERAAATDVTYKLIVNEERNALREKTRLLRQARMAVASAVSATVR